MPQVLQITAAQHAALSEASRRAYLRRLHIWLLRDPRTAAPARALTEAACSDLLTSAQKVGVTAEEDVTEFAVLRLLAPASLWSSPAARDILDSSREGALKVFQLRHAFAGKAVHG